MPYLYHCVAWTRVQRYATMTVGSSLLVYGNRDGEIEVTTVLAVNRWRGNTRHLPERGFPPLNHLQVARACGQGSNYIRRVRLIGFGELSVLVGLSEQVCPSRFPHTKKAVPCRGISLPLCWGFYPPNQNTRWGSSSFPVALFQISYTAARHSFFRHENAPLRGLFRNAMSLSGLG